MTKNQTKEIAMIAAIISDCITKKLYKKVQEQGNGYIVTVDIISEWAMEFYSKHKKTNWEEVMDGSIKPLSKQIKSLMCWDDVIFDFAYFKFELL